jgi:beta-lactamase regulating signal transducer with metallopeptidase domain
MIITAAFTVPSFLLLEPRSIDEPIGGLPLVFGVFGSVLALFGVGNALLALRRASRAIRQWTLNAAPVFASAPVRVLRIGQRVPAMTAAGIVRPRVLISNAAEFVLTPNELKTALNHEVAHVRRRDNLKKLVLRFVAFPGMRALESAWLEATEMAADDAAVSSPAEALDLAAALIKMSRLGPVPAAVDVTAALIQSPVALMNARVERLIAWRDQRRLHRPSQHRWYVLAASAATVAVFILSYSTLLARLHAATEWLVR